MKLPLIVATFFLALPAALYAQDKVYSPLVDLSNAGAGNDVQSFEQYINFLYGMSIAVAALLAVIKIIIAGAKYMMSDVIGNKEGAKNDIQGAVLGLLLIISAVVILELINPTLIKKEIKFDEFQSERGALNPLALQTVGGGQTMEQHASSLAEGLDACVVSTDPQTSASGKVTIVVANANPCGDKAATQLSLFAKNCTAKGGKADQQGNIGMMICATPIDGIKDTETYAANLAKMPIPNTINGGIGSEFIKQVGTTITIDANGACDKFVEDKSEASKRGFYANCMQNIMPTLENSCEYRYGKFDNSNTAAITCQLPKSVKETSQLTSAFESFKAADPSRKYHTIDNLSEAEQEILCEKFAKGLYVDNTGAFGLNDDVCVFY
jgi:hypothetical protein